MRGPLASRLASFFGLLSVAVSAFAGNEPAAAQHRAEDDLLPKIAFACGAPISLAYDGDSLRKNNSDIGNDQTDGENECNEPLRYLWYACKSEAGKAAVRAARITKIACRGVAGSVGSLGLSSGTVTVERALGEKQPYVRSRKQFESLLHVPLTLSAEDPYADQAWHDVASQPNPVTSTTTYCLVGPDKVAYDENVYDSYSRRKQDAQVRCWKDGAVVIDLRIDKGHKTGFLTQTVLDGVRRVTYRDDKLHGEERRFQNGKLASVASYDSGETVWRKELRPDGRLASYTRKFAGGSAEIAIRDDGHVTRLRCVPQAKDDADLRKPCGFDGAATTSIYDGTGKVARVLTWKDGVLQQEGAGNSAYAPRSEVSFKDGKKQGEERILQADGTLASTIHWNAGVKDGSEISYGDDGKKITKEVVWKAGAIAQLTERYLNGNPKLIETYESPLKKRSTEFWDTGKVALEGDLVMCEAIDYGFVYRDWCEEGLQKTYYEGGAHESEVTYRRGKRQGPTRTWWENGKPASLEDWADDKPTKARRWAEDGRLVSDDEFEPDGSRKIRH
jgi:antitoxin component YwqK of YwqJK toxin-antitoxin module